MTDLIFDRPLPDNNDLIFGDAEPVGEWEFELVAHSPPSLAVCDMAAVWSCEVAGRSPDIGAFDMAAVWSCEISGESVPLVADVRMDYDNNVFRGPRASLASDWQMAQSQDKALRLRVDVPVSVGVFAGLPWRGAVPVLSEVALMHALPVAVSAWCGLVWQGAVTALFEVSLVHAVPVASPAWCGLAWQGAVSAASEVLLVHAVPVASPAWCGLVWQGAAPLLAVVDVPGAHARAVSVWGDFPWQDGRHVSGPGVWVPPVEPEPPQPPRGRVDLVFRCDLLPCNVHMDFAIPCCGQRPDEPEIPILRTYMIVNEVVLLRERDNRQIKCYAASLSLDDGTWSWDVSVSVGQEDRALIGRGERLRLIINGHHYVWLAESWGRQVSFGAAALVTIKGRSQHAELDIEPQSGVLENPTYARQLADAALEYTGYELDWRLPDWLIPAGAYSWESLSRINRVADVVESVGGVLYGAPDAQKLIAASRWPVAPWDLSDDDCRVLPTQIVNTLGEDYSETDERNAVLIVGERAGYVMRVKRTGTAGDKLADTIIHPLLTDQPAGRERGMVALAETMPQCAVSVELPLLSGVQPFLPSDLARIAGSAARRGAVRSVRVDWSQSVVVNQSLEIDTR